MSVVGCTVVVMVRGPAGHIERLPSGSWRVKVYAGTDPLTGREIRLRKTCKTARAAPGPALRAAEAMRRPDVYRQAVHRAPERADAYRRLRKPPACLAAGSG